MSPVPPDSLLLARRHNRSALLCYLRTELTKVRTAVGIARRIVPHMFRLTFATEMLRSGLSYPAPGAMATIPQDTRGDVQPAPRLGQHTDEVLAELLGMSGIEIGRLHDAGVVAGADGR